MDSRASLDRCGKSRPPPPGFDPRTIQSVASRYTDYAITAFVLRLCSWFSELLLSCFVYVWKGRCTVRAGEGPKDKTNMKMMSLLEKVELVDKLDR